MQPNLKSPDQEDLDQTRKAGWLRPVGRILVILIFAGALGACSSNSNRGNQNPSANTAANAPTPASQKNSVGMELVYINPGNFMMGSRLPGTDEGPLHRVVFKEGFWMGKFEVTQSQWESVMGTTIAQHRNKKKTSAPLAGEGADYPMYYVSLDEASEFIKRLNAKNDGFVYSLPSEAQWEYAARAGTTENNYGDLDDIAWYSKNSGKSTHPVGGKRPNAFGLYDMSGNVFEICTDVHNMDGYEGAPTDGSANTIGDSEFRVARGGSWEEDASDMRVSLRVIIGPSDRTGNLGFRVVARTNNR